jgi:hypothetical protein
MTTRHETVYLAAVLCAGLLFLGGCKDLFHPEGPKQQEYTVSYHANGANGTPPATQTVNAGSSLTLSGQGGLTYTGYTFSGWNTNADGTGTLYSAGDSYTPTTSVTLYALWTLSAPVQYTVTFDADGGTPITQTKTVDSGASLGSANMPSEPDRKG